MKLLTGRRLSLRVAAAATAAAVAAATVVVGRGGLALDRTTLARSPIALEVGEANKRCCLMVTTLDMTHDARHRHGPCRGPEGRPAPVTGTNLPPRLLERCREMGLFVYG